MNENIKIQNIYYMLSYTFEILKKSKYERCGTESFENIGDILTKILVLGINFQLNRGLIREYKVVEDENRFIKGKILIDDTIKKNMLIKRKLSISYDQFQVNVYFNKILKTTLFYALKLNISLERKKEVKKLLIYFDKIDILDFKNIKWDIKCNKNNKTYEMLINVCYLLLKGFIQNENNNKLKILKYIDEKQISKIYEKFVLNYYKKEYPEMKVSSKEIKWNVENKDEFLPKMKSDVTIEYKDKVLIIDTKYYSSMYQRNFEREKIYSNNLYQIFTYVKNEGENRKEKKVSGMLLYAKTDEIWTNKEYEMSGNKIYVNSLDLNKDFENIKKQLNEIVENIWKN